MLLSALAGPCCPPFGYLLNYGVLDLSLKKSLELYPADFWKPVRGSDCGTEFPPHVRLRILARRVENISRWALILPAPGKDGNATAEAASSGC
jgi:hypothetical protein